MPRPKIWDNRGIFERSSDAQRKFAETDAEHRASRRKAKNLCVSARANLKKLKSLLLDSLKKRYPANMATLKPEPAIESLFDHLVTCMESFYLDPSKHYTDPQTKFSEKQYPASLLNDRAFRPFMEKSLNQFIHSYVHRPAAPADREIFDDLLRDFYRRFMINLKPIRF